MFLRPFDPLKRKNISSCLEVTAGRMRTFLFQNFTEQGIILGIGYLRLVKFMVKPVVTGDLSAEFIVALLREEVDHGGCSNKLK